MEKVGVALSEVFHPAVGEPFPVRPERSLKVALVNMPWGRNDAPSLACGILKSGLVAHGHDVTVHYPNLDLSRELTPSVYDTFATASSERLHLFGEWLFGAAAFDEPGGEREYLAEFPELAETFDEAGLTADEVLRLRSETLPAWIRELARRPEWSDYDLIGFTSTFFQNVAAIALARRIKEQHPGPVIVFGGANFDGEMGPEYVRRLPWIDCAVIGEADLALPRLAAALSAGRSPVGIPGVCARAADGELVTTPGEPPFDAMDAMPFPDHSEYFDAVERLGRAEAVGRKPIRLLAEFSRGCWWGQKHHCTFCGLNALGMQFRSKSPGTALREIEELLRRHRIHHIDAVDNIIDMRYLSSLCEELRGRGWDTDLFFEVKANLTADQLALLGAAGIRRVQPGIESLSTHVLGLMRKGSTMLMNVRFLKWARHYRMNVTWNMLSGFPGERDEDFTGQAELAPLLAHLQPPNGLSRIWLERFSPYFTDPGLPIRDVRPREAYRYVYPVPGIDHAAIAYFFDYRAEGVASAEAVRRLSAAVADWRERWQRRPLPILAHRRGPGWLDFHDSRFADGGFTGTLAGWQALAYELCGETARSPKRLHGLLREAGAEASAADVDRLLALFAERRITVSESGKHLALALPLSRSTGAGAD
nr:RiPP maturation radical SAM C-methyltransferase [Kitasatospora sp. NRRL B-11411]